MELNAAQITRFTPVRALSYSQGVKKTDDVLNLTNSENLTGVKVAAFFRNREYNQNNLGQGS